ncbi:hypothetical protein [Crocosphaera sp.]|uniref:hypothetical protein n=1 Tax=Crocosphaera sp. TaxID=2729996 RepID=UPI003F26EA42|nr:hypothetical protein [Crocosphaera sp.]
MVLAKLFQSFHRQIVKLNHPKKPTQEKYLLAIVCYNAKNIGSGGDQPLEVTGKVRCKSVAVPQL